LFNHRNFLVVETTEQLDEALPAFPNVGRQHRPIQSRLPLRALPSPRFSEGLLSQGLVRFLPLGNRYI
jgi:hypothetical protein